MNPAHKNPSFRQGTHPINQPSCLSQSSLSPLLEGELEAMEEQRTKSIDFLEHEKEAPMGEMQKKSSAWALIKMSSFPKRGDTPLVNCSCEHKVYKRTGAAKFAKPCIDERQLEPRWILMATFCKLPRCRGDRHPLLRVNHRSPTGRTCWSLHRSLSHTRHAPFLCLAASASCSCQGPLFSLLQIRANKQENPRLTPAEVATHDTGCK